MKELNTLQKLIISKILFVESFDSILEETREKENLIAADLKALIDKRYVQVYELSEGKYKKTFFYDTDNMRAYFYSATEKGLSLYGSERGKN